MPESMPKCNRRKSDLYASAIHLDSGMFESSRRNQPVAYQRDGCPRITDEILLCTHRNWDLHLKNTITTGGKQT
jgi:hypothetical protein